MLLQTHDNAHSFLDAAAELLSADEARHNLIYGICTTLIDAPAAYPVAHLWTVDDPEPLGALLMTPPHDVVVARFSSRTIYVALQCSEIAHRSRLYVTIDSRSDPTSSRFQISRARKEPCGLMTGAELFFDGRAMIRYSIRSFDSKVAPIR